MSTDGEFCRRCLKKSKARLEEERLRVILKRKRGDGEGEEKRRDCKV